MTKLIYNNDNTEGHYPTSYDFRDTELKKDDKIVATDLVDLYDVEVDGVVDKEILVYNSSIEKWVPGEAGGAGCNNFENDVVLYVGNGHTFPDLISCFRWLNEECVVIPEDITIYISIASNLIISEPTSLNHPYGHNITIKFNNHKIYSNVEVYIDDDTGKTYYDDINNIYISNNHNIKEIIGIDVSFSLNYNDMDDLPPTTTIVYWTEKPYKSALPPNRGQHSAEVYNGKEVIFGGQATQGNLNLLNDLWLYDPKSYKYEQLFPRGDIPSPRFGHDSVIYGDYLYVFGGASSGGVFYNDLWRYDFMTNAWNEVIPTLYTPIPRTRFSHTIDIINDRIYLFGGGYDYGWDTILGDTWCFDISANEWTDLNPGGDIEPIRYHTSTDYNRNNIFIVGGYGWGGGYKSDVYKYSVSSNEWTKKTNAPQILGLTGCCSAKMGTRDLYVWGGAGTNTSYKFLKYDLGTDIWTELDGNNQSTMYSTAVAIENKIYITCTYLLHDINDPLTGYMWNKDGTKIYDGKPEYEYDHINQEYILPFFVVKNNSLINKVDVDYLQNSVTKQSITDSYINTTKFIPVLFEITNNSFLEYNLNIDNIYNNSEIQLNNNCMVDVKDIKEHNFSVNNKSTVLTDDITKFNNSTFINSKLIEKK